MAAKKVLERDFLKQLRPIHPGEMLREEFLVPMGLSANALALALRVPVTRILQIVNEKRGITADTALRLAIYFNMSPDFWMNLQTGYELSTLDGELWKQLKRDIRPQPRKYAPQRLKPR